MKYLFCFGLIAVASAQFFFGDGALIDEVIDGSEYNYSWLHDGNQEYTHAAAVAYCNSLGPGWAPISIETPEEDNFVTEIIVLHRLKFIWTGGYSDGFSWRWLSGYPFVGINWSPTGGDGHPQPDNREGNEYCLGVLNNFYSDGINWHDIACHHPKPTICERSLFSVFR